MFFYCPMVYSLGILYPQCVCIHVYDPRGRPISYIHSHTHPSTHHHLAAVAAYTRWARRYALRGLLVRLLHKEKERGSGAEDGPKAHLVAELLGGGVDVEEDGDWEWGYRRELLQTELGEEGGKLIRELLEEAVAIEAAVAAAVESSKARDDKRGLGIVDDYMAARGPLEEDKVIKLAKAEAALVARAVGRLGASPAVALPLDAFV